MTPEQHGDLVDELFTRCTDDPDFLENRLIELIHFNGDNLYSRYLWGNDKTLLSDNRGLLGPRQL